MHKLSRKPLILIVAILLISMACSIGELTGTEAPKPTATEAPKVEPTKAPVAATATATAKPEATKEMATPEAKAPKGAVTSLDDVKSATIQIQSQGTFIDPQVGMVVNGAGRGSGFIIDPSGIAVTNNHVVTGAALLKVWVGGNKDKVYNARVLGVSECSDLAVIKIDGNDFPFLQWYDSTPKVGLEVYAAGYPLGDPEYTLTKGIISKANANGETSWASVGKVLEHDARINPGNSGGPLIDKNGKIVGINYAANDKTQYFAIARAEADSVLSELKAGTDVNSIGVNGEMVMSDDQTISGLWVSSVKSGSPADKSGVKAGDIIIQLEGLVLGTDGTKADYCQILRSHKPSDTLSMNVLRWKTQEILEGQLNGRQLAVTRTLSSNPPANGGNTDTGGTTTIYDDADVISMEAPNDWEYDGSIWEDVWKINGVSYNFSAQTLSTAPNIKDYSSGWTTKGIFVATSADWGKIGGYANLLEGVKGFYTACQATAAKSYKDDNYEGMVMLYTRCGGTKGNALVLAARPIKNPQAYLVLIEMKYTTDAELDELDVILSTTDINP